MSNECVFHGQVNQYMRRMRWKGVCDDVFPLRVCRLAAIVISGSARNYRGKGYADTAECTNRMQDSQMAKPPGDNDLLSAVVYLAIPRDTRRNI